MTLTALKDAQVVSDEGRDERIAEAHYFVGRGYYDNQEYASAIRHFHNAAAIALLNEHLVRKASEEGLIQGRKVRVDTTAVEAHMHHPTDASLIADGIRVITRLARRVKDLGGAASQAFQDRTRSIRKRLLQINKVVRRRTGEAWEEVRRITAI